jgi:hypothetical protein
VTGGIHAVHNADEGTPTVIGDEVGIFQRNAVSAQSVAISLISGTASQSSIYFGDKDDIDAGKIVWDNSSNNFRLNAMTAVKIAGNTTTGGNIQFGITGNNSAKYTALTSTQYAHDSETEGYALITGNSYTSAINQITIGGGLSEQNAATSISLTTATNATTRTGTSRLFISSVGDIICNENSTDSDFRVESDNNSHALFVEGSGKGIAVNSNGTNATGFDSTLKLGGSVDGGGLVAYVQQNNVANGSYVDVNVGNSNINYWTGMLGVNNSSMSNGAQRTQSLTSILANNQTPTFSTSVLHTADGSSAASFTVTYVDNGTIRITNTSGVSTGISAWFTGGGTQF